MRLVPRFDTECLDSKCHVCGKAVKLVPANDGSRPGVYTVAWHIGLRNKVCCGTNAERKVEQS